MRFFILSIFVIISANSFAQKEGDNRLLWEISGNGLKSPSYLYGTMHVSNKIAFHLADSFFIALDQADLICLESDPSHWIDHMYGEGSSKGANSYGSSYGSGMNFYEKIVDVEAPSQKLMEHALRKKHALENGFLYRGSTYNEEYEENTYLDLFIYQYAQKNKKEVLDLEDFQETNILQIKAMFPDEGLTDEEKKEKKKKRKSYYSDWNKDMTIGEAMEDAYRNGNIDIIDSITRITATSDNYLHYFLHERNRIMTEGIDTLAQKQKIFIGIGAAHLPGEKGVIQMLIDKGYKMRPVKREITQFAKDKKNDIEEQFLDRKFKTFTTKDGYITVDAPGDLYETPGTNGELQYFYPDMANGGYFFVTRFQTYAPLNNSNATKWEEKIDSIIFENVEGKIIKQSKLKIGKYNAIDILNKTRKGDFQRRLIVFTPLEVIFFKMAGTGEWAKLYGDRFVKSVKINDNNNQATTYSSHLGEYKVDFPNQPISTVHAHNITPMPQRYLAQSYSEKDSSYYLIQHDWMNDFGYIEEDSFEVAYLIEAFLAHFDSLQTQEVKTITSKKAKGYAVLKSGDSLFFHSELKNNFYFILTAKSSKENADKFFDSFKLTGKYKEDEYQVYHDTLLRYSVNTPIVPDEMEDWRKLLDIKREEDKEAWDYSYDSRSYFYKRNYESIRVSCLKHSDYYYVSSIDSLWLDEFKAYLKSDLVKVKEVIDNNDTMPSARMWFSDTNSTKVIDIIKYSNQGVVYTIKSSYDSTETRSKFIDEFYKTFKPNRDTLLGKAITDKNSELFFSDLQSTDTNYVNRAVELVNRVIFRDSDVDSIISLIENYEFPHDDEEETALYLIRELGYLKHHRINDFLAKKYENATDDYKVQIACLKALAKQANKKSYNLMNKLIIQEPPVTPSDRAISTLFRYLDDSLALTSRLYPDIWDLLLYTDYRESVYDISAVLLDSNLIKSKSYKRSVPLILREAKEETASKKDYYSGSSYVSLKSTKTHYAFGKKIVEETDLIDQYELTVYLKLLMPHYKKNEKIKKYLHSLLYHNKEKFRYVSTVLLTKENVNLPDSLYTNLSKSNDFRFAFYNSLKRIGKEDKFDQEYLSQELLMESAVYSSSSIEASDSLKLIKKVYIKNRYDEGYVYFFKHQSEYSNKWYIDYAGLQPEDSLLIDHVPQKNYIDTRASSGYTDSEIEEEIEDIIKIFKLLGRQRATSRSSYGY